MTPLALLRARTDALLAKRDYALRRVEEEQDALGAARVRLADLTEARTVLQGAATAVQEHAHRRIASVVTRCLRSVFGENAHEFRITFVPKRGRTEAVLSFVRDGEEMDPLGSCGGGMADVASFALRLVALVLARPRRRKLLVLDEPMKNVNGTEYQGRVGELLELLAAEFGVQIVLVTDDDWLKIGKVIEL